MTFSPAQPAVPFLTLQQVSRRFRLPGGRFYHRPRYHSALTDVTLTLFAGEQVGLVGASGAGKSTLLKALLALEPIDRGQIRCQERIITPGAAHRLRWFRRLVQYIPQDPASSLAPNKTVAQLIAEPLRHLGDGTPATAQLQAALAEVDLPAALLPRRVGELSGGQAQRVAIARAIALRPAFLVADEPVSGLDLPLRQQVSQLFLTLARRHGMGLLMVSHDISAVAALCQRVLVMNDGRIVEDRPLSALLSSPSHPHTRELLAALPTLSFPPLR